MGAFENEKRKNDQRRRFQWWLLVVGFVFGVIVTVLVMPRGGGPYPVYNNMPVDGFQMTATEIIRQVTATAQGTPAAQSDLIIRTDLDPIQATATHIIQQATQQAANP